MPAAAGPWIATSAVVSESSDTATSKPSARAWQRGRGHVAVGGVGDHQVRVVVDPVHHQVVEDAAVLAEQQRVLGAADGHRAERPGERVVEERDRLGTGHADLGHVRQVEHPGCLAHGVVLGEVGGVAHGHAVTGEVGERGTGGFVCRFERGRAEGWGHGGVLLAGRARRPSSDVNSPSVMGLRVSPRPVRSGGFHRGRDTGAPGGGTVSAFQSGLSAAVLDLRDWRGGCSFGAGRTDERWRTASPAAGDRPRCSVAPRSLPRSRFRHVTDLGDRIRTDPEAFDIS